jgi:hypothetical protein
VEIATPNFPVSGQRAEIAKVENSSPSGPRLGPNIAFPFLAACTNHSRHIVWLNA